ncbi:uncharacterized protein SCDLUD_000237 [Saccharomycodes ludwigii]|uniref:uncharacterized protein n=1 Tax=Saccharomycodes ludwigii TaxID=36035 RepID=UPI001E83C93A|nr:hypothetical protein SCDLUD_000237 [Saccharomycodes ludwigii]KAH3902655.1 hypothetical protein SCDLUD_000237 [Saccharomycodes ludwigii]
MCYISQLKCESCKIYNNYTDLQFCTYCKLIQCKYCCRSTDTNCFVYKYCKYCHYIQQDSPTRFNNQGNYVSLNNYNKNYRRHANIDRRAEKEYCPHCFSCPNCENLRLSQSSATVTTIPQNSEIVKLCCYRCGFKYEGSSDINTIYHQLYSKFYDLLHYFTTDRDDNHDNTILEVKNDHHAITPGLIELQNCYLLQCISCAEILEYMALSASKVTFPLTNSIVTQTFPIPLCFIVSVQEKNTSAVRQDLLKIQLNVLNETSYHGMFDIEIIKSVGMFIKTKNITIELKTNDTSQDRKPATNILLLLSTLPRYKLEANNTKLIRRENIRRSTNGFGCNRNTDQIEYGNGYILMPISLDPDVAISEIYLELKVRPVVSSESSFLSSSSSSAFTMYYNYKFYKIR